MSTKDVLLVKAHAEVTNRELSENQSAHRALFAGKVRASRHCHYGALSGTRRICRYNLSTFVTFDPSRNEIGENLVFD